MELTWTTFILEIINFLVLVWVLKRFFYAPVRRVIDERRETIERSIAEADEKRAKAEALEAQYRTRLDDWEQERQQARERLQQEMAAERERLLAELNAGLEKEREKRRILDERRREQIRHQAERQALVQGARFAARVLTETAGREVQDRLFGLLLKELPHLSEQDRTALAGGADDTAVEVTSAYPLSDDQRRSLEDGLGQVRGRAVTCEYSQDGSLIAGFRIAAGAMVLRANVRDELQFFGEVSDVPAG